MLGIIYKCFAKLKRIWKPISGNKEHNEVSSLSSPIKGNSTSYHKIEAKKDRIKREKESIVFSPLDLQPNLMEKGNNRPNIYVSCKITRIKSLKELKEIRLKKEAEERELLKRRAEELLLEVDLYLKNRDKDGTKSSLDKVAEIISRVNAPKIKQAYERRCLSYDDLVKTLERERRQHLEKERKRKEEEERKKFEEKERLRELSENRKENWREFESILQENRIAYLYHFTDKRNLPSIKEHGGLYSWGYCEKKGISIPCQGGDSLSKRLDKNYKLEDYVRLSFCSSHPMAYRLKSNGSEIVVLKIRVDVAYLEHTLFSNMNATDKRHKHGSNIEALRNVNFQATKMSYLRSDSPYFKLHQAEVMVKTFVPLKYIVNINEV